LTYKRKQPHVPFLQKINKDEYAVRYLLITMISKVFFVTRPWKEKKKRKYRRLPYYLITWRRRKKRKETEEKNVCFFSLLPFISTCLVYRLTSALKQQGFRW